MMDQAEHATTDQMDANKPRLGLVRLPHGSDLALPAYESAGAAGMDLRAANDVGSPLVLASTRQAPSTATIAAKCRSC